MKRVYKETTTTNTLLKIKGILNSAGIVTYDSLINNPHDGIFSTRLQTIDSYGCIGQNGKGTSLDYALASGYAEFMERIENGCFAGGKALPFPILQELKRKYGYYFFPDEKIISEEEFLCLPEYLLKDIFSSISKDERILQIHSYFEQLKKKGLTGCVAIPFRDLTSEEIIYIPYNIFYMLVGSNGMAAGNTIEEAIFQGTCELYERYSAALIYYNRLTPPTIPHEFVKEKAPTFYNIIVDIESMGFRVVVKDFSINGQIPSVGVLLIKANKYRLNIGSDTCFEIALGRCLTEVYQGLSDDHSIELVMNPIPQTEFSYFLKDDTDSISKKTEEFIQFVKNGMGKFPKSLFKGNPSYPCSLSAFQEKNSYKEEVKNFIQRTKQKGFHFLVRNSSFLGFPAVHVYIPKISSIGRKNSSEDMIVDINLRNNVISDEAKSLFQREPYFLSDTKKMERLLSLFPTNLHSNIKLYELLDIDFKSDSIYRNIPISYLLTLISIKLKRYKEAISYLNDFVSLDFVSNKEYYQAIKEILNYRIKHKYSLKHQKYNDKIEADISDENIFKDLFIPLCPKCSDCKLTNDCLTKGMYKLQDCINQASQNIRQEILGIYG